MFPESSFFSDLADLNAEKLINTLATLFKGMFSATLNGLLNNFHF